MSELARTNSGSGPKKISINMYFKYMLMTERFDSNKAQQAPKEKLQMNASLFERIGGETAVNEAVDIFYRKVLMDDRISHFFDDIDMDVQAAKQKSFLTMAFGGPNNYSGADMRRGHAHLVARGLNDSHVDAVVEDLIETLQELNVPQDAIDQVVALCESVRGDVLCR